MSRAIVASWETYSIDSASCGRTNPSDDSTYHFDRYRNGVRRLGRSLDSGGGIDMDLQEAET